MGVQASKTPFSKNLPASINALVLAMSRIGPDCGHQVLKGWNVLFSLT